MGDVLLVAGRPGRGQGGKRLGDRVDCRVQFVEATSLAGKTVERKNLVEIFCAVGSVAFEG
jgi:hypothetical protein